MLASSPAHAHARKASLLPLDTNLPPLPSLPTSPSTRSPRSFSPLSSPSPTSNGTSSGKRRFFRLKRPSSANAAYTSDLRRLPEERPNSIAANRSNQATIDRAPPRPPRNPARDRPPPPLSSRPSTSSGIVQTKTTSTSILGGRRARSSSTASHTHPQSPHSPLRGFGPILSAGSDFVLQRKKSRGSKAKPRSNTVRERAEVAAPPHVPSTELQFCTTDRRILEELKRKMQAREAQFALVNGKRHHPYRAEDVPYPCSYERRVVDNDIWECKWGEQTCGSLTWHCFDEPPLKVLDIGCGTGSWILDCAVQWKDTQFVGLDIVPLHADLYETGSPQLASRIRWVQANFLEGLPFANEEFDFVHVKRIARGVPEDRWDPLFEEILRVMKPGAAFQLLEEELTFPGKPVNPSPPKPSSLPTTSSGSSPWSSSSVFDLQTQPSRTSSNTSLSSAQKHAHKPERPRGHTFAGSMFAIGVGLAVPPPAMPMQSVSYPGTPHGNAQRSTPSFELDAEHPAMLSSAAVSEDHHSHGHDHDQQEEKAESEPPIDPRDHSLLEYIYSEMHAARFINLEPLALLTNSLSLYFTDVRTHPPLILTFPPLPTKAAATTTESKPTPQTDPRSGCADKCVPQPPVRRASAHGAHPLRASTWAPEQPGDAVSQSQLVRGTHRYVMLDDSRIGAVSPASSRPASVAAQAATRRRSRSFSEYQASLASSTTLADSTSDGLNVTVGVSTVGVGDSVGAVLGKMKNANAKDKETHLPTSRVTFDVRTLNMHLALRTQEILACAESMWTFVLDRRAKLREHEGLRLRALARRGAEAQFDEVLMTMTRREFDMLLDYFELDMQDSICLGEALQERLGWAPVRATPNERRKAFVQACKQWAALQGKDPTRAEARRSHDGETDRPHSHLSHELEHVPPEPTADEHATTTTRPAHARPLSDPAAVPPAIPPPAPLAPAERISRIMRVFVAWKS